VDGGVQLLGLKRNDFMPTGSDRTDASTPAEGAREPKWASLLGARIRQAAGLGKPGEAPLLEAPLEIWPGDAAAPAAALIIAFTEALTVLRDQLDRERRRADAAGHAGQERLHAAEARVLAAEQDLRQLRDILNRREAELAEAHARAAAAQVGAANAVLRAELAERDLSAAKQENWQLRARGLLARILNRD
jgi:hypothetical protein